MLICGAIMLHRADIAPVRAPELGLQAGLLAAPARPGRAQRSVELNFVYAGSARYFMGGGFVQLAAGTLAVFWGAFPHQLIELQPKTELMYLRLPLASVLRFGLASSFLRKLFDGDVVTDAQNGAWDAALTRRWLADLAGNDRSALHTCELEVEARLRRLAGRRQQKSASRPPEHKAGQQVEAITAFLAAHRQDDISTAEIGRAVGLHPNYAMTLFRRECGMSIWQYLIRLRLSHAELLLLTTDKPVLAVALESGFGSLARFYAAFTRECGTSPGEYRRREVRI